MKNIQLAKDTIDNEDIKSLIDWLAQDPCPRLTKDVLTKQYEEEFAKFVGSKYAVFVNSGSSANLMSIYAYLMLNKSNYADLERKVNVIVPAVSWATTVAPVLQLGLNPILCDCDKDNLGIDLNHFEQLCSSYKIDLAIIVHVLGFPAHIGEIKKICKKYNIFLIEDTCESLGSTVDDKKVGTFGDIGTYSSYYGHQISTIEGGVIVTDNKEVYDILKMVRNHGWDRDLDANKQRELRKKYNVDEFQALYTFYYPGFNFRSTDLQAFIGLRQLEKIQSMFDVRYKNVLLYDELIKNNFWKIKIKENTFVSNHAYPLILKEREKVVNALLKNGIETRPLICGSIGHQPFWVNAMKHHSYLKNADLVHNCGIYVPNHHLLKEDEVRVVCNIINEAINE